MQDGVDPSIFAPSFHLLEAVALMVILQSRTSVLV